MKLFAILSSLYVLKSFFKHIERDGLDERLVFFPYEMKNDNVTKMQIMKIQETREMLDFLESNETTPEDKLYEIGGRGVPSIFSILKGGLLSDWNFEFDSNEFNFDGM
jgi:membrane protease subunit (stomatin/prohibitin family)